MTDKDLENLLIDTESDLVERKSSDSDRKKISQAICAYANDLPDYRRPGVVFVGVNDDGSCANLPITDELLLTLADMRSNGNIVPFPTMTVQKKLINECELAVITVQPSDSPPVRYKGRTWIRVGPRRAAATREDERLLSEKRRFRDLPFDLHPVSFANMDDMNIEYFLKGYLPLTIASEIIEANDRSLEEQLASLRFIDNTDSMCPTVLGLLVCSDTPEDFVPGAYIQFLRIDGTDLTDPIKADQTISGPMSQMLNQLNQIFQAHISESVDIQTGPREIRSPDYPITALQQIAWNAVLHRNYEATSAPVRITWFSDRIEILNPGGPYGLVTRKNFGQPGITDYRNQHLAEAMKNLGYIQKFGIGIQIARKTLEENGNPPLEFIIEDTHVLAILWKRS